MALDIYAKNQPATPPVVNSITFALDGATGLWKGTGADATVNAMTAPGSPFFSAAEVQRFKYEATHLTAKATALSAARTSEDSAAATLAGTPGNTTYQTNLTNAASAVAQAQADLTAANTALRGAYNGKFNPFL